MSLVYEKKILFIAPCYFSLEKIIIDSLLLMNYNVTYIEDDIHSFWWNFAKKMHIYDYFKKRRLNNIIKKNKRIEFDLLFVIKGAGFTFAQWNLFFQKMNVKKKILYEWDSNKNFDFRFLLPLFDEVYSFDRHDCVNLGLNYRPLFYKKRDLSDGPTDIDLLFVGIWHSDRVKILSQIYEQASKYNLNCFFKIYCNPILYIWLRYIKGIDMFNPFLMFKPIKRKKLEELYGKTKCIIDINHPDQIGLTSRTIEALGNRKHLITTNSNIREEFFYKPDTIQIVDRKKCVIDFSFLNNKTCYNGIDEYEISNWLKKILQYDN